MKKKIIWFIKFILDKDFRNWLYNCDYETLFEQQYQEMLMSRIIEDIYKK